MRVRHRLFVEDSPVLLQHNYPPCLWIQACTGNIPQCKFLNNCSINFRYLCQWELLSSFVGKILKYAVNVLFVIVFRALILFYNTPIKFLFGLGVYIQVKDPKMTHCNCQETIIHSLFDLKSSETEAKTHITPEPEQDEGINVKLQTKDQMRGKRLETGANGPSVTLQNFNAMFSSFISKYCYFLVMFYV